MHQKWIFPALVSSGFLALSSVSTLAQPKAYEKASGTNLEFQLEGAPENMSNFVVTVTGPNGHHAVVHSKKNMPSIDLGKYGKVSDGLYRYHITAATGEMVGMTSRLDNGRGKNARAKVSKSISLSGMFTVKDGSIEAKRDIKEE